MKQVEEKLQEALKPGTATRKAFFALSFFVAGLLFVLLGFWQTLLIAALTLAGLFIGSSESLADSAKQVVNKVVPSAKKPVTYSAEDIQKVREAREQDKRAREAAAAKETSIKGKVPEVAAEQATEPTGTSQEE